MATHHINRLCNKAGINLPLWRLVTFKIEQLVLPAARFNPWILWNCSFRTTISHLPHYSMTSQYWWVVSSPTKLLFQM